MMARMSTRTHRRQDHRRDDLVSVIRSTRPCPPSCQLSASDNDSRRRLHPDLLLLACLFRRSTRGCTSWQARGLRVRNANHRARSVERSTSSATRSRSGSRLGKSRRATLTAGDSSSAKMDPETRSSSRALALEEFAWRPSTVWWSQRRWTPFAGAGTSRRPGPTVDDMPTGTCRWWQHRPIRAWNAASSPFLCKL